LSGPARVVCRGGVAWGSPFTDSAPGSAPAASFGVVGVGVAGWNAMSPIRGSAAAVWWWWGLGMLLGPEGTPVVGVVLVPLLVRVV
jgi:hypothetical protein